MLKKIITVIMCLIMIGGIGLLAYPGLSDYLLTLENKNAIANYIVETNNLDENEYAEVLKAAEEYNDRLANICTSLTTLDISNYETYYKMLDVTGTGLMGYVQIPSVNINLPIYHGTDEAVLQIGVGHIEGSSLPVGGTTSHCILSGHRGLPSAKLFTNIDKIKKDDYFFLQTLKETYAYQVDTITVIMPEELGKLTMHKNEDICTLVTCTPYGINTHRLVITGHRTDIPDDPKPETIDPNLINNWFWVLTAIASVMSITAFILLIRYKKKQKRSRG